MFFKFPGPTDLNSWARDFRLETTTNDEGAVVAGTDGFIYQHTDDLLAATITARWVSSHPKLITAGCELVQDGDKEGTVSFDPNDTDASLAVLKTVRLK